jgi:L-ascorbate metabolism protein UlaG (beta-lactamase superfamily)
MQPIIVISLFDEREGGVMERVYYLSPDVIIEPLLNQWYAWGQLVSPATFAMISSNLHLRILESYLRQPEIHRAAIKDQQIRGGMFMEFDGDIRLVEDLFNKSSQRLKEQIKFSDAVRKLDIMLSEQVTGVSLAGLYKEISPPLRGTVELHYDLLNRASYRFIEPFLYASSVYDETLQSIRISLPYEGPRPFVLSSPRFPDTRAIHLDVPFHSSVIDRLSQLRYRPAPLRDVHELIGYDRLTTLDQAVFDLMLTETPPPPPADAPFTADGIRIRYFGHATVLIESASTSILIDPAIAYDGTHDGRCFSYADLPQRIDKVLLTHNHQDHVMLETLLQIRHRVGKVVVPRCASGQLQDPSLKLMLQAIGFDDVVELDELEALPLAGGCIRGVPFFGEHADLNIRSKLAYAVSLEGRTALFLADSNALEPAVYDFVRRSIGPVDALFVGLECDGAPLSWLYGSLFTRPISRAVDQSRRLNSSDCAGVLEIVNRLDPASVYIYAMGLESWLSYISSIDYSPDAKPIVESNKLLLECEARGLPAEHLYLKKELRLPPGNRSKVVSARSRIDEEIAVLLTGSTRNG